MEFQGVSETVLCLRHCPHKLPLGAQGGPDMDLSLKEDTNRTIPAHHLRFISHSYHTKINQIYVKQLSIIASPVNRLTEY